MRGPIVGFFVLLSAAVLEVGGDAVIRHGLRRRSLAAALLGFLALGSYGVAVNLLGQDFSRTLGTYVGVFALVSVLAGKLVFRDAIPASSWCGLAVILAGCAIIQLGPR
jgi:small multidrug resistance family-3 protein